MRNTDIYLHFNGNCEAAFLFYQSVFGGEFIARQRYRDVPGGEKMNAEAREKIMHISLQITPYTTLLGSDVPTSQDAQWKPGNNFHICLHADNEKEADDLFHALSNDGKIEMPMNKTFWGAYFGMCEDPFGIQWMINYSLPVTGY